MLTLLGRRQGKFCDGISRRTFMQIGGLTFGGLSLPQILRAESVSHQRLNHKGIINIYLPGGPPHQDMWDLKPDAPAEIRGEFNPIKTNVSGIEICEQFPRLAQMADKLVFIRSMIGAQGDHAAFQCQTGRRSQGQPPGGWPSMGSCLSKLCGPVVPGIPPFVGMAPKMGHMPWADSGQPGFLGLAHAPFKPSAEGRDNMVLNGLTLERLRDRKRLLGEFDRFRRDADTTGAMAGLDAFENQALGILTSSSLADALDLSKEDPRIVERYGKGDPKNRDDGGPKLMEHFLIARRLIEAGTRCVTVAFSRWDWHGQNFKAGRQDMPMLDQGVSALVEDLHNRGLDKDVSVVVWGEFGRTPKINKDAGRDHWPQVSCALLACGGLRTGQVVGATNRFGEFATERPVTFPEVYATLYHALGIDTDQATVRDLSGRPQYLVDHAEPMKELI
ncbi:MAG TPA: DUF1501 domain-containing protein [Pirellulales bacterium]|jgi:hypothetical protein|nr:DUF1501 domain-containing protein [Pirellulales bacterium]